MSKINYESQIHYMMSYAGIRSQILHTQEEPYTIVERNTKRKSVKKQNASLIDTYKDNDDIICVVQSDALLLQILTCYRKQKIPLAYIYVNGTDYLTFIVKVPSYYPVLFVRLPVNNINVYVNPNHTPGYYVFPITHIQLKTISRTAQYQLILKNPENTLSLDLITYVNSVPKTLSMTNISAVSNEIIGTILSAESLSSINAKNQLSNNPVESISAAPIMSINAVNNTDDIIQFVMNNEGVNSTSRIIFSNEDNVSTVKFTYANNHINETTIICNEKDAIYWNSFIKQNHEKYNLEAYSNVFRINYSKAIYGKNKMYYVIVSYLDSYLFIKLIWSGDILIPGTHMNQRHVNIPFSQVFDKNIQVMECYMLRRIAE